MQSFLYSWSFWTNGKKRKYPFGVPGWRTVNALTMNYTLFASTHGPGHMTFITSHFSLSFLDCHCFIKSRMVLQFTLKRTWRAKFHGNLSNCCPVGGQFHSGPLYCIPLLKAIALFIPIMSSLLRPLLPGPNTSSVWHILCLEKFKHPSTGVNRVSTTVLWPPCHTCPHTQYTVHTLYPGMIIWHILTQTQRWTHKVRMTQFHLASFTFLSEVSKTVKTHWVHDPPVDGM